MAFETRRINPNFGIVDLYRDDKLIGTYNTEKLAQEKIADILNKEVKQAIETDIEKVEKIATPKTPPLPRKPRTRKSK